MDALLGLLLIAAGLAFLVRTKDVDAFFRPRSRFEWQRWSLPFVIRFVGAAWIVFGVVALVS